MCAIKGSLWSFFMRIKYHFTNNGFVKNDKFEMEREKWREKN